MRKIIFISFLLIFGSHVWAQKDTFQLKEVVAISVLRSDFNVGASTQNFDSLTLSNYQSNSVGDLLNGESGIFIKSYGLGSLATSSVRGAGASHTKVLWNGLDISNPMLGQVDFSYLNVNQFDAITIQKGNTTGLYGGGTQGGVIQLDNNLDFNKGDNLSLNLGIGSFGQFSQNVSYGTSTKKNVLSVSINNSEAENNFKYQEYNTEKKRENAQLKTFGANINNSIRLNNYSSININNWYQQNERGIPSAIGVSTKDETLFNEFFRNSIGYNYYGRKIDFKVKGAHFMEQLNYVNPESQLVSNSKFQKTISEIETQYRFNDVTKLTIGLNTTIDKVYSLNFIDTPERKSFALFGAFNYQLVKDKIITSQSVRKEFVQGMDNPLSGSFGIEYKILENISIMGSTSKNYRLPTFNDLYYSNLGNPDLKAEEGYGSEVSTKIMNKIGWVKLTGFYNDYENWINWQPQDNGLWQPQNNNVETKGLEFLTQLNYKNFFFRSNATYTESVNVETGKQMIYVPKATYNASLGYFNNGFLISIQEQFTSHRYISTDNNEWMPYFLITNFNVSKSTKINEGELTASFKIKNIFNTNYQVIINQPMPGRFYELNLNITFKNKQT